MVMIVLRALHLTFHQTKPPLRRDREQGSEFFGTLFSALFAPQIHEIFL